MADETKAKGGVVRLFGRYLLACLASTAAGVVIGWLLYAATGEKPDTQIQIAPPVVVRDAGPPGDGFATGWVADPDEVAAVVATLPVKVFADTPAGKVEEIPRNVYGWKAYEKLFARPPPVKDQGQVGSCVSFGTNTAIERTLAAEIVGRRGTSAEWTRYAEEATYGGSRVEIGGGRIRGDGSVGAWAAQFVTRWGVVPRKKYDTADLSAYSESRARDWGRGGVPAEFETVAREFPVESTVQVKSWDEAKTAIAQGYFIAVCSNQGFARQRDANGVARASGSWAHCMALDGYHTDDRGREYGHIVNSWGDRYHTGPVGWGDPGPDGFWAEASVIDRMLRQGDSWAFSGVHGFPAKDPWDWFLKADPQGDRFVTLLEPKRIPFTDLSVIIPRTLPVAEAQRAMDRRVAEVKLAW